MCGLTGIIANNPEGLGIGLTEMLKEIEHRGRDATGFAVYEIRDDIQIRVSIRNIDSKPDLLKILEKYEQPSAANSTSGGRSYKGVGIFDFYETSLNMPPSEIKALHHEIDCHPDLCVHSLGEKIKVYKDQGTARDLESHHRFNIGPATHGIGHVRLATESLEDINFAHPFISEMHPELSLVHNGQFTNYFNLRRSLETKGVRFKTNNDSEIAVQYLAFLMEKNGGDLEEAIHQAMDAFDGVFTIIVSTEDQIGIFRDELGMKPVLFFETDDGSVLFGSEEISLAKISADVNATEMEPGGVKVWSI
ncbi:MAG: glutamine amidotransferase [SAR324 cluster bacterium]|jgi:hypothetical protein|nr:glutamine amidotransferase [SAR324 cluster bacterium]HCV45573.1 glutamine amidotransferase [Deltaproteobacteria bacterium]|tara:strand:+ start:2764 stop:3681 length:918 start_codon:yes stop_codon:yes gene_type:complete